jgi:hypothetical protein
MNFERAVGKNNLTLKKIKNFNVLIGKEKKENV